MWIETLNIDDLGYLFFARKRSNGQEIALDDCLGRANYFLNEGFDCFAQIGIHLWMCAKIESEKTRSAYTAHTHILREGFYRYTQTHHGADTYIPIVVISSKAMHTQSHTQSHIRKHTYTYTHTREHILTIR